MSSMTKEEAATMIETDDRVVLVQRAGGRGVGDGG